MDTMTPEIRAIVTVFTHYTDEEQAEALSQTTHISEDCAEVLIKHYKNNQQETCEKYTK